MKNKDPKKEIILNLASAHSPDRALLRKVKRKVAKKYGIDFPSNRELLATYREMTEKGTFKKSKGLERVLVTSPVRSLSGIVNVTVLTKPAPCPGECIFCPAEKGFPKSYVAGEPAADRAKGLHFDPYAQVTKRLSALKAQGHPTEKIELRIVGGTWSAYSLSYQKNFVKNCFRAANRFPGKKKPEAGKKLKQLQKQNQKADQKIVGISVETRPDLVDREEITRLRHLGVTMVEMGVQTVFDKIHARCRTGLTAKKIARATRLLKDAGFKVLYQIMPNLPGSWLEKDEKLFDILFSDPRFKPDWLKIYPCLACKNTPLYRQWKKGKWKPYSKQELTALLTEIKKDFPCWVRVARVFRDIPAGKIEAGVTTSNIREVVEQRMRKRGERCRCVRCREVRNRFDPQEEVRLFRKDYQASKGKEVFLSFQNKKRTKLFSLLRLRSPASPFLPPLKGAGIIREIQTFGPVARIGEKRKGPQHRGLGSRLVKEAEKIAQNEFGFKKMAVISGVGARNYYRKKHRYRQEGTYMTKMLRSETPG